MRTTLAGGRSGRCGALLAGALVAAVLGSPAASADEPVPALEVSQDAEEVREYWTPKRMREAIPARTLAGGDGAAKQQRGTIAQEVNKPGRKPRRSHGKVFFSLGSFDFVCSGTALRSLSGNVVWTAAHCVYDQPGAFQPPEFASNWIFVPAYKDGRKKLGEWVATDLAVTAPWRNDCSTLSGCNNLAHDFGAANVQGPGSKSLQQRTMGRKIVFDGPRDLVYRAFGYPAGSPFNGQRMYKCKSPWQGNDPSVGSPAAMEITCDMTGGSSGGGWITKGAVRSVISYGYEGQPDSLYGPYQGSSARNLFRQVKNG